MDSLEKSKKNGALEKVTKIISTLLVIGALGLAGCASDVAVNGGTPAGSRIVLRPSDDSFRAALQSLSPTEREAFKKGLGFTIDTLVSAPTNIEKMAWSRGRADTPALVDICEYVRYLDQQPALKGPARVNVATAKVFAGVVYDEKTFDPVFRIQAEVEPASAAVVSVTGFGAGPMCSRDGDDALPASPQLTHSAQVAFMKAFLKTLLKINDQLQQG
jgi:hypothetical protein